MSDRKSLIVYHHNCADGFAAAWVFWKSLRDTADYMPGTYTSKDFDISVFADRNVYLVDFSYKRPVMEQIIKVANNVVLLDHHVSALKDLEGLDGLRMNHCSTEHSGAMLCWNYWYPDVEPPFAIQMIEDRDLWKFKYPETRNFSQYLFSLPYDFETWDRVIYDADHKEEEFYQMLIQGAAIERKHLKDIDELAKHAYDIKIGEDVVPCLNVSYMMASDAGNKLSIGKPYAVTYYESDKGVHLSFRSQSDGKDVSLVAASMGGGGHKHASGATISRAKFEEFRSVRY